VDFGKMSYTGKRKKSGRSAAWLAHQYGVLVAAGSNPVAPISFFYGLVTLFADPSIE
jgi:hypothetical protein